MIKFNESIREIFSRLVTNLLRGIFIGATMVLPGMSGGTALIITGIYKKFLEDISSFNFKPYIPVLVGALAGALGSALFIRSLLEHYPDVIVSVLLGMILSSAYLVLSPLQLSGTRFYHAIPLAAGAAVAFLLAGEPLTQFSVETTDSALMIFSGGLLASGTMLLPGISGSAVLIMINLFDDMLEFINQWNWVMLLIFSLGLAAGVLLFARLVYFFYSRYFYGVSFFLSGLLLGTVRALTPSYIGIEIILYIILGGLVVVLPGIKK